MHVLLLSPFNKESRGNMRSAFPFCGRINELRAELRLCLRLTHLCFQRVQLSPQAFQLVPTELGAEAEETDRKHVTALTGKKTFTSLPSCDPLRRRLQEFCTSPSGRLASRFPSQGCWAHGQPLSSTAPSFSPRLNSGLPFLCPSSRAPHEDSTPPLQQPAMELNQNKVLI